MKKKFLLLLVLLFFVCVGNIYAEPIKEWSCEYTSTSIPDGPGGKFILKVFVTDYDATNKTGTVKIDYYNKSQGFSHLSKSPVAGVDDVSDNNSYFIFPGDSDFSKYVSKFDGHCKTIYWYRMPDSGDIHIVSNEPSSSDSGEFTITKENIGGSSVNPTDGEVTTDPDTGEETSRTCEYPIEYSTFYGSGFSNAMLSITRKKNMNGEYTYSLKYDGRTKDDVKFDTAVIGWPAQQFSTMQFVIEQSDYDTIIKTESCLSTDDYTVYLDKNSSNFKITTDKQKAQENNLLKGENEDTHVAATGNSNNEEDDINTDPMTCEEILGPVLTAIVKYAITIIQIAAAIIAIVKGMLILIPAVVAKDADALKKAGKTLVILGIILAIVIVFRPVIRLIGTVLEYDVSCII